MWSGTSSNTPKWVNASRAGARRLGLGDRALPGVEVDVGRRRRSEHEAGAREPHAHRVARIERAVFVEERDVVARVAGLGKHCEPDDLVTDDRGCSPPGRARARPTACRTRRRRAAGRSPPAGSARRDAVRRPRRRGPGARGARARGLPRRRRGRSGCARAADGGCRRARAHALRGPLEGGDARRRTAVEQRRAVVGVDEVAARRCASRPRWRRSIGAGSVIGDGTYPTAEERSADRHDERRRRATTFQEVLGEVFGLTVRSRNIGSQIGASFKSLVGGELGGMTKMLAEGREEAIRAARRRGGDERGERHPRDALRHLRARRRPGPRSAPTGPPCGSRRPRGCSAPSPVRGASGRACRASGSDGCERLLEVGDEIVGGLDPDRQPHEVAR